MSVTSTDMYQPIFSFHSIYPNLNWFFFSFEKNFEPDAILIASKQHKALGPIFCVIYFFFVLLGPRYMKNKKPYDLRKPLQYWNLSMTVISTWGMLRVIPHLILYISYVGLKNSFCLPPGIGFGHGALGFWSAVFIYSKFIELIDTVFLVLRKRPLTFLHWYHHLTVLGFSWHAFIVEQPVGVYFCAMNYTVHSLMYLYYYFVSLEKDTNWLAVYVTAAQVIQMFLGTAITFLALYFVSQTPATSLESTFIVGDGRCLASKTNLYEGLGVYITYLYLFCNFFWNRYFNNEKKKSH